MSIPVNITNPNELKDLTVFELWLHNRNFILLAHAEDINSDYPYRYWEKGSLMIIIGINKTCDGIEIVYPCDEPHHAKLPLAESECMSRFEELFVQKVQPKFTKEHPFKDALTLLN